MDTLRIEIPSPAALVRHAVPNIVEGTVVPLTVFLVTLRLVGVWGAMAAGLAVAYGLIALRLLTRRRVPGILVIGALTLTARTLIALVSRSAFVYFLQPTLGTALVATAFLLSAALGRPLTQRLAHDFCPFEPEVLRNRHVRTFFSQISLLWAFTQFANAAAMIWLLLSQSLTTYVVAGRFLSVGLTTAAIALSTAWFHHSMARNGILVSRRVQSRAVGAEN